MFLSWILGVAFGYLIGDIVRSVKSNVEKQQLFDAMQKQQLEAVESERLKF